VYCSVITYGWGHSVALRCIAAVWCLDIADASLDLWESSQCKLAEPVYLCLCLGVSDASVNHIL